LQLVILPRTVGQVVNLRPIVNRPGPRRVNNPPQVDNLPYMLSSKGMDGSRAPFVFHLIPEIPHDE
jgi:hypothetical protein